jgi:hypothetical protein
VAASVTPYLPSIKKLSTESTHEDYQDRQLEIGLLLKLCGIASTVEASGNIHCSNDAQEQCYAIMCLTMTSTLRSRLNVTLDRKSGYLVTHDLSEKLAKFVSSDQIVL